MKLLSIQVGLPQEYGNIDALEPNDRVWRTGFLKSPVVGSVYVSRTNIAGDGQADLKHHGGLDKAVCCYSKEHWDYWETHLGISLPHGAFGENFTLSGCLETDICIGDIFVCGDVVFQVSQPRQPCWKLARRWRVDDLAARVEMTGKTGWYLRVLQEGRIESGTSLSLTQRLFPELSIAYTNEIMHKRKEDWDAASSLSLCPALSESWKATLSHRAEKKMVANSDLRLKGIASTK